MGKSALHNKAIAARCARLCRLPTRVLGDTRGAASLVRILAPDPNPVVGSSLVARRGAPRRNAPC